MTYNDDFLFSCTNLSGDMLKLLIKKIALIVVIGLCACTPKFDWREVRNEDNFFQVLMPGKVANANREINLNGVKTTMYMTAADVQNIRFFGRLCEIRCV